MCPNTTTTTTISTCRSPWTRTSSPSWEQTQIATWSCAGTSQRWCCWNRACLHLVFFIFFFCFSYFPHPRFFYFFVFVFLFAPTSQSLTLFVPVSASVSIVLQVCALWPRALGHLWTRALQVEYRGLRVLVASLLVNCVRVLLSSRLLIFHHPGLRLFLKTRNVKDDYPDNLRLTQV